VTVPRALLPVPPGFNFRRTVLSHGWYGLPPFRKEDRALAATVATASGAYAIRLEPAGDAVAMTVAGRPSPSARRELEGAARRMLNLDLDLGPFHDAVRDDPRFAWIAREGSGRMLRGATVFEDVVKLVMTTNCSWSLTVKMVTAAVERYGEPAADGTRAFPTAERLASVPESAWRDHVRAGYRAPSLRKLAGMVAKGEVDPEGWPADPRPVAELRREILALPGAGPYVAENLLKFWGRPDGLALDSWMRAEYARLFHGGRKVTDRTIGRSVARLGAWGGLALWFHLTKDWVPSD
jgi:3-methyladenine DNA glycosylase/8-oxoguanine DNA glycosylase